MREKKILSPSAIAWQRFRHNALGMIASAFILVFASAAIFAYFIIPDNTPDANRQLLELSTQKPGFTVDMLMIPKEKTSQRHHFSEPYFMENPTSSHICLTIV
jgi:hypothetical protein